MYNPDTELLFPPRLIPGLRELRGPEWDKLIDQVSQSNADFVDRSAFIYLMVQIHGCTTCQADSFRAMQGCTQCSQQTVRRMRETDNEIIVKFSAARDEIIKDLESR